MEAESVHHGDEEVGERDIGVEAVVGSVFETELISSGKDEGVVRVVVSGAVAAAVEDHGVIEEVAILLRGILKSLEEVGELGGAELIPFTEGFGSAWLVPTVGEAVLILTETEEGRELAGDGGRAVHVAELVGEEAGGVGLNGEEHEVEHRLYELAGSFVIGIKVKSGGIHFWFGDIEPLLRALDPLFDLANGLEVFVELFLILFSKAAANGF